jgi:hypothetical protein
MNTCERSIPFSILFAFEPRVYVSSGYKLMRNHTRFIDADGHWKTLVYHGSMYANSWADLGQINQSICVERRCSNRSHVWANCSCCPQLAPIGSASAKPAAPDPLA